MIINQIIKSQDRIILLDTKTWSNSKKCVSVRSIETVMSHFMDRLIGLRRA